jgi:hypothetical protein
MSKWKEFSEVPNRPDAYSNFSNSDAVLDKVAGPVKIQQLWEIGGDHADNVIQAESAKRKITL